MRKLRGLAAILLASILLIGCGGGAKKASTSTTAAPTTAASPTTTLAAGETPTLAAIIGSPPPGYKFVDAPKALTDELQTALRADSEASAAIKGYSAHSVVRNSDNQTVGAAVLVEVDPTYSALPGFEKALLEGMGAEANPTGTVKITDSAGTTVTWTKATDNSGGSSDILYYSLQHDVIFMLIGSDSVAMEKFLAA